MTNNARPPLLLTALVIFATAQWVIAADETSRNTVGAKVANDGYDHKEIAAGFKLERYTRLWQRNPFAAVTPVAGQAQRSVFDKLFLASWLKDGGKEVIFVQDSETNEVQRITAEPNQNNLRLIEMHLDTDPRFVQAVISDGMQQGTAKFRFDANSATVQTPKPAELPSQALPHSPANLQNAPVSDRPALAPGDLSAPYSIYHPGIQRVGREGGRRREVRGKQVLPSPVPGQSN